MGSLHKNFHDILFFERSQKRSGSLVAKREMKTKSIASLIEEGCSAINAER